MAVDAFPFLSFIYFSVFLSTTRSHKYLEQTQTHVHWRARVITNKSGEQPTPTGYKSACTGWGGGGHFACTGWLGGGTHTLHALGRWVGTHTACTEWVGGHTLHALCGVGAHCIYWWVGGHMHWVGGSGAHCMYQAGGGHYMHWVVGGSHTGHTLHVLC